MNVVTIPAYPEQLAARDRWIVDQRGPRTQLSSEVPYAFLLEAERFATGDIGPVATIFLTNRECPWRCAMCDLWKNTLSSTVPVGSIPTQIRHALERLGPARQIKLYNAGSFFDRGAIPNEDYAAIAALVNGFERVIVESHPSLVGDQCFRFQSLLQTRLEVAMGLETAHPVVLEKLNKRMTLEQYRAAADRLAAKGIALRSFVLVQPPFMRVEESLEWACTSIDFAIECGATAITLLPTRGGNGAMEALTSGGAFVPPSLATLEAAMEYGIARCRCRVFVDLWDIDRVAGCAGCQSARVARLALMNGAQAIIASPACAVCGGAA